MKFFFDSNILIYANSEDHRRQKAIDLLSYRGVISIQVLNECANILRRKLRKNWEEIEDILNDVRTIATDIIPLNLELHQAALKISTEINVSFYDALIIAAAQISKCSTLYSEDMQHGQKIGALTIINPFI
jgi:predicted nucleic acid-binding protein